jgi:HEAT repeat protein
MRFIYWFVLTALLWAPVCGAAQDQEALLAAIRSGDSNARREAVEKLLQSQSRPVAQLVGMLYGQNMNAHRAAEQALAAIVHRATRPAAETERAEVANALLKCAQNTAFNQSAREKALYYLSLAGGRESVPGLSAMLSDPAMREMARFALVRIAVPEAGRALTNALTRADPAFQVAILGGLAERKERAAAPIVSKLLRSTDPQVRRAAIETLGSIPDRSSAELLWGIRTSATGWEKIAARDAYIRLAESLLTVGSPKAAEPMFSRLSRQAESAVEKCAALRGLAKIQGAQSTRLLLGSLNAPEPDVRGLAASLLVEATDPTATAAIVQEMKRTQPAMRLQLVEVLSRREGAEATNALFEAAKDSDSGVRLAALRTLVSRKGAARARLLATYHDALPSAASDEERQIVLAGIERLGDPASLPLLRQMWEQGTQRVAVMSAMLPIADTLAASGRREEAVAIFRQAVEQGGDSRIVREGARKLRQLGIEVDVASQLGHIGNWWVLGPINGREEWRTRDAWDVSAEIDLSKELSVGGETLRWRYVPVDDPQGMVDLEQAVGGRSNAAAYLYAEVTSPSEMDALLRIGSDDDVVVWLNGQKVHQYIGDRGWGADQDTATARLKQGRNTILVKVLNGGGQWACSLRITDRDGKPMRLEQRKR